MSRQVSVGTIGHIDHGRATLASLLLAVAAAGLMCQAAPTVMPTRRPELEPGYDLNQLLADAGNREQRKASKAERKARLQDVQRAAFEGRR